MRVVSNVCFLMVIFTQCARQREIRSFLFPTDCCILILGLWLLAIFLGDGTATGKHAWYSYVFMALRNNALQGPNHAFGTCCWCLSVQAQGLKAPATVDLLVTFEIDRSSTSERLATYPNACHDRSYSYISRFLLRAWVLEILSDGVVGPLTKAKVESQTLQAGEFVPSYCDCH